ncbi:MAG TPA: MarR family transcriptional regulator [Mycobacteriales bacterium]|jgi:DNA-binding MarR family transcriptional regulator|nr:MarR family transcriptional regulator [Mycobacteriales bacterium]
MPTRDRGLTHVELDAWRAFLRAHARVTRVLDAELAAECDLPLGSYEVLLHLNEAPGGRLRMTDLADRVLLSRSGLTRLVDRLERDGLLRRESCPSDLRGTNAVLTDAGLDRLRAAAPVHLRGVREHMLDALTEDELRVLAEALGRVAGPPPGPGSACG